MYPSPGGKFTASNITLWLLIETAYRMQRYQLSGAPAWLDTEKYDIAAEADHSVSSDELKLMLQALLSERFKLAIHKETREMAGYALTVTKNGPKLNPPTGTKLGVLVTVTTDSLRWTAENETTSRLAERLSGSLGQPVLDKTGLHDRFSFTLEYARNTQTSDQPSIFTAIQEQLGLKLDAQKAPCDVFVIDRVEKASEN